MRRWSRRLTEFIEICYDDDGNLIAVAGIQSCFEWSKCCLILSTDRNAAVSTLFAVEPITITVDVSEETAATAEKSTTIPVVAECYAATAVISECTDISSSDFPSRAEKRVP